MKIEGMRGAGLLYLRMLPSTIQAVHTELGWVFELYSEDELKGVFIVIEPGCHRVRRTTGGSAAPSA